MIAARRGGLAGQCQLRPASSVTLDSAGSTYPVPKASKDAIDARVHLVPVLNSLVIVRPGGFPQC